MSSPTRVLALILALATLAAAPPSPSAPEQGVEGTDFRAVVPPQPTSSPGKIEVIEFFSYGCPHCNDFNPLITAWAAKLPKDVVLRRGTVHVKPPPGGRPGRGPQRRWAGGRPSRGAVAVCVEPRA